MTAAEEPSVPVEVTAQPADGSEPGSVTIVDDYVVTCAGTCYVHHVATHANGTHVITIRGRRAR